MDKNSIPLTNRKIFHASHRKHYQASKIKEIQDKIKTLVPTSLAAIAEFFTLFAEVNEEFSAVMNTIADRRSAIEANMISNPLSILEEAIGPPSDPSKSREPIARYVEEHIDDGEGAAIDYLVMRMQDITLKSKLEEAVAIYPLVYTEHDPCRCCLLSIRPYLTGKIRRINTTATIMPIVVATGIYHEKSEGSARKVALRYCYPWWESVGLFPWKPMAAVQKPSADAEAGDDVSPPPPTSLYLYHMPAREIFKAIHDAETAMASPLPPAAETIGAPISAQSAAGGGAGSASAVVPVTTSSGKKDRVDQRSAPFFSPSPSLLATEVRAARASPSGTENITTGITETVSP